MPAQALYRKWRPQLWDEVVGQEAVVQTLRHALGSDHIAHAYLFAGPRGCGGSEGKLRPACAQEADALVAATLTLARADCSAVL